MNILDNNPKLEAFHDAIKKMEQQQGIEIINFLGYNGDTNRIGLNFLPDCKLSLELKQEIAEKFKELVKGDVFF